MLAEIPKEWRSIVCQCPKVLHDGQRVGFPPRVFSDDGTRLFTCVCCHKPSAHCLYRCVDCSSVFLKDFSHRSWVLDWPKCWICLNKGSDRAAEIILGGFLQPTTPPTLRHRYLHIIEPDRVINSAFVLNIQ